MGQKKIVAKFKVSEREFSLFFYQDEFILELQRIFQKKQRHSRMNAWLSFEDEPCLDDIDANIDAFMVMREARTHLVKYIHRHQPRYFVFHASTARKAKIYPRFARALLNELPSYRMNHENGSFYFYRNL